MSEWPDAKIRSTALWYIGKHLMDPMSWRFTLVRDAHPGVSAHAGLGAEESPLLSFFLSEASWYVLSTRRVIGSYCGREVAVAALDVVEDHFGDFRGYGGAQVEVMTLRLSTTCRHRHCGVE
jgi:hypothetical protein